MAELGTDSPGAEQRKWKIVGGLGVALVVVVWLQFDSSEDPAQTGLVPKAKRPEIPQGAARKERPWPRFELSEVLEHDPFLGLTRTNDEKAEVPGPVANEEVDPSSAVLAAFQARRVRAIFVTRSGPAAILDSQLIHEGDIVNGVRIVSIRTDGLVVEAVEIPPQTSVPVDPARPVESERESTQ